MTQPRRVNRAELEVELTAYVAAVQMVLDGVVPLGPVSLPVIECDGMVLATDMIAGMDVPRWDNSAMDGYAIDSAASANAPVTLALPKIMTGHPLPAGANAVVPWEETHAVNDEVTVKRTFSPGEFVRRRGEDVRIGDLVIAAGTPLAPAYLGLAAALGHIKLEVVRRPRVTILCTGDEIATAGAPLGREQVYDANGPMLAALLRRTGVDVVAVRYAKDDADEIRREMLAAADTSDAVVTTGGASVGEYDWTRVVLAESGELTLWRVAVRPGRPIAVGRLGRTQVFVLPGNPASVLACTHAFVTPALRKMAGREPQPRTATAVLAADLEVTGNRTFLCPVELVGDWATPSRAASSSVLSNQLNANAFLVAAPGYIAAGTTVTVELLD